jgi:hypothetical protein
LYPIFFGGNVSEETPNTDLSKISRRNHVTPGERLALIGLRNKAFYAKIKNHATASADENPLISMEGVNGSKRPTQSVIINKGNIDIIIVLMLYKSLNVVMIILSCCFHRNCVSNARDCSNTSNTLTIE